MERWELLPLQVWLLELGWDCWHIHVSDRPLCNDLWDHATYLLNGAGAGAGADDAMAGERSGAPSEMLETDPLLELPLFKTLLALLINLENPCGFSSGPPDPPWADELIVNTYVWIEP